VGRLVVGLVLSVLLGVSPAAAFLVEVTTSVDVREAEDRETLQKALLSAVDGVLKDAIAFTPTLIVLTHATVVADRLYIRLLVADQDGERTFEELHAPARPREPAELRL
jgi:hypothetical protein